MFPYGHYTVHQTAGEEGKAFIPDFTVFINENGFTYSYILNNRTITVKSGMNALPSSPAVWWTV